MKNLTKLPILFFFAAALLYSCDVDYNSSDDSGSGSSFTSSTTGKGDVVKQTLNLDDFKNISLGIGADIMLRQGSPQKVEIEAQQNIIDLISTDVSNETWKVKYTQRRVRTKKPVDIYITIQDFEKLSIGGSGDIVTEGTFTALEDLDLDIGGSGLIDLDIDAKNIELGIGGSGEIKLKGVANDLDISISGSGEIAAYDLKVKDCEVSIAGSGEVKVSVQDDLDISIVGSGDIYYKGNPNINKRILGSGGIYKKD